LESSIYLLSSIASLPENTAVLPIINTNHSTHIAAKLPCPPYTIVGQNQISHPGLEEANQERIHSSHVRRGSEDGYIPPGTLTSLTGSTRNIFFSKNASDNALPGKIERIFYVNPYGHEVHPSANPKVIQALRNADVLIYSIGSLFTRYVVIRLLFNSFSIIPCLIPKGVANVVIQASNLKYKIFLLNKCHDRETTGFTSALDYIQAIVDACHISSRATGVDDPPEEWTRYITHVVYLRGCKIQVDVPAIKQHGIECVGIWPGPKGAIYEPSVLERVLVGICSGRGGGLQRRATVQN
jgi:2-phospho-L-lactate transferase CofD